MFYRYGNSLRVFNTRNGKYQVIATFSDYTTVGTGGEGRPSDDWRYYCGVGTTPEGTRELFVMDLRSRQILGSRRDIGAFDWVGMSPSGAYAVVMHLDNRGTLRYDRTLAESRQLIPDSSHADFAIDQTGNEVLVYPAVTSAQLVQLGCPNPPSGMPLASARLSDGQKKILLGDCNTADWQQKITGTFIGWGLGGVHVSGIASRAHPGWVLISTINSPTEPQEPFGREVFWLALDGSGSVRRLAHHHSDPGTLPSGERDYFAEAHATSSWDGSIVFFASSWGQVGGHYDEYELTSSLPPTKSRQKRK